MGLKRNIRLFLYYCTNRDYRDYRAIRRLHLFDPQYYFRFPGDGANIGGEDPLLRYFAGYRRVYKETGASVPPATRLADPHPLFDSWFYLSSYFPQGLKQNPFAHYLLKGWRKGLWPSPYFDPDVYRERSDWDRQGDPLSHYRRFGAPKGISPGVLFDIDWYIDKTPVLAPARKDIIRHYKMHGAAAGKSPIPVFNPEWYRWQVTDHQAAQRDPLAHYLVFERENGPTPNNLFDPGYYRHRYLAGHHDTSPLSHYLRDGVSRGNYTDGRLERLAEKPVISVLVPVYNTNHHFLNNCIRSVFYQAYPHWELCLVDDHSSDQGIKPLLQRWADRDSRIRLAFHERNTGISGATASAAGLASGDYLGFLDHDDELTPDCLYQVARTINETGAEVFYSDEDLVGDDGSRHAVFCKPDFNRQLLSAHNYITHFVVISQRLYREIGGIGSGYDGAQDYELLLRASEKAPRIVHIPQVLYHWRAVDSSTSINHEGKPYAHEAGKRALADSLARRRIAARVDDGELNFHYRLRYRRATEPAISVFLWHDGPDAEAAAQADQARKRAGYDNCEILPLPGDRRHEAGQGTGRAALLNQAIGASSSDHIAILGAGAMDSSDRWLDALISPLLENPELGIVCGRVTYHDGDGPSYTVPALHDLSTTHFAETLCSMSRHLNGLHNPQLVRCCNWWICLFARSLFEEAGGFDHRRFPHLLAMLDFSFKTVHGGKKILYTPAACVQPAADGEIAAPGGQGGSADREKAVFQRTWRNTLLQLDPFYSPVMLAEHGLVEDRFLDWLAGEPEETLDLERKLH